ncbi:uncharacterized protein LOC100201272 isoform X1 [Hydra vulgaris]|uniref:uncharacterized protein LOC100201272 isoform X1 n=1 Tax=Hydra vulgaris TaxID=6087 RepID=UPI001F5FD622|nr:uncharacterized protein LOC100201272 isoform X1 [Hydra vulgaris]XP_047136897.1 uncharacterized protein LOC100201272 isoform X1 [Hydra vulgaris]
MYFITFLILVRLLYVSLLDINECQSKWVPEIRGGYIYQVDCSNLGFKNVPENISSLTSELLLNGNSISYIDDKAFFNLTPLRTLDLRGNDITKLEETVFKDNQELKKLHLSGNKLHCDWSIWWLVSFLKKLEFFDGQCFTPILLRGRNIKSLTLKDLEIDCLSVSKLRNAVLDGDYPMTVFRKDKSTTEVVVYCHKMSSTEPKEYLTLPSGEKQNYVEVSKQCDSVTDQGLKEMIEHLTALHSNFTRVRLFLNNLTLSTTDTTFSTNPSFFFGQPSICGDKQCLSGRSSSDLRGTPFYFKSSKQIIMLNECNTQCGKCDIKTSLELDFIDSDRQPFLACTRPIGMQSNKILNQHITASSNAGQSFAPHYGRLNLPNGWCSGSNDVLSYLQIDLVKLTVVTGISTQGHPDRSNWITSYKLFYSKDDEEYQVYKEFGEDKILEGNINSNSVVTHWFLPTIQARFVRVNPSAWNDDMSEHKLCMRVELYGCLNVFSSYLIQNTDQQCIYSDIIGNKEEHLLKMNSNCAGDKYMFTFSNDKVQHTKSGLCLSINSESTFILTSNCATTNLMFQTVESHDMFLIKDLNGNCAKIFGNVQNRFLNAIWLKCESGGFSRLRLTNNGTSAILPRFNEVLVKLNIKMFTAVKLTCEAHSDPISIYRWRNIQPNANVVKYDLMSTTRISFFEFENITWEDGGLYVCEAWNFEGFATKTFDVFVQPIQWFHTKPSNQKVLYGNSMYFDCISQGYPEPKVSWFLMNGDTNSAVVSDDRINIFQNGTLFIKSVSIVDEGNYTCKSSSPRLEATVFATLDVYVTQSFIKVPELQKVLYSHDAFFECVSEGQPKPLVSWYYKLNGKTNEIKNSYKYFISDQNSLTVCNLTYDDIGEYICVSKSPRLIRNVSAELDVYVTQEFLVKPTDANILYGSDHILDCNVTGVPMPHHLWVFNSIFDNDQGTIISNENNQVFPNGSLVIKNVTIKDSGNYYCVAYSPGMSTNVSSKVNVIVTQKFTYVPTSQISLHGHSVLFDCQSEGIPPPLTSWYFHSLNSNKPEQIVLNNRYSILHNNSLLVLNAQDADEGNFICVSTSPGLITNVSAQLYIYSVPKITLSAVKSNILVGQSIEIICNAVGDPTPIIQWYKLFDNTEEIPISNKERLIFLKSKKEDAGTYICEAKNVVGIDRGIFELQIQATCSLDMIENENYIIEKHVFVENEVVFIKCKDGFRINGSSHLSCLESGSWNETIPLCDDINECEGETLYNDDNSVNKNTICDVNSQCVNNFGSYQCQCNEGLFMVNSKCEHEKIATNYKVITTPAPQSFFWLDNLMAKYKNSIIDEVSYLQALRKNFGIISKLPYYNWRLDAVSRLIESLHLAVQLSNEVIFNENQKDKSVNCIQIFAASVSSVLTLDLKTEWAEINKKKNGSILLMKYTEEYVVNKVRPIKKNQLTDLFAITFENLDINIQPVTTYHKDEALKFSMIKDSVGVYVKVPNTNYPVIESSMSIAIIYKYLDKLLPKVKVENVLSPIIGSQVFSFSFSHLSKALIKPLEIRFKLNQVVGNGIQCSYWDFQRPYSGGWASDNCKASNASSNLEILCECLHLTNFAVIVPQALPYSENRVVNLKFTLTAAVGVLCLLVLAFLICVSHICCSSYWKSSRQTIICNLNLVLILSIVAFSGGVIMSYLQLVPQTLNSYFCFSLLGTIQIMGVGFFGWIFAESIQLYFSTRIAIDKGGRHLILFYFCGWGIPIVLLTISVVLVYFNKFNLQLRCTLHRFSFELVGIAVGMPSLILILATLVMHLVIYISIRRNKELLNPYVVIHTRRALHFSKALLLIHVLLLGSVTTFLHFNSNTLYHHIFGVIAIIEGIYLVIYHGFFDRKKAGIKSPKLRTSHSAKDTVVTTVSGNHGSTLETLASSPLEQRKSLLKPLSKNLPSSDSAQGLSHATRTIESSSEQLEWDNSFADMYGVQSVGQSSEMKPLLNTQVSHDIPEIIYEENLARLSHSTFDSNHKYESFNRNANSLPRRKHRNLEIDEYSNDGSYKNKKPLQHINSRASSIVSIEKHSSGAANQVIPVYFPVAPPHYEMTMKNDEESSDVFPDSTDNSCRDSPDASCRESFVIDSNRMSTISSELTNILFELQAFNTKPNNVKSSVSLRDTIDTNLDKSSTFRPQGQKTKTMIEKDQNITKQLQTDNNRIRGVRGRTRAEADPSDGYHAISDNYGSL